MKRKKITLGYWKVSTDSLHWVGFSIAAMTIIILTAYGFSLSLRPNSFTLESAPEESLAVVGVALANNIGTDIPRANEIPVDLPADVSVVQYALNRDGIENISFFDNHFTRISEFTELLNIDVVNYLRIHIDRSTALESYISQLQGKKQDGEEALSGLRTLHDLHINALSGVQDEIKNVQNDIESAYNNRDGGTIIRDLSRLEELHIEEQEHTSTALFAQRIAAEYSALIPIAEQKIIVLQANTAPLVQGVTVKLPQGVNIDVLKNLRIFATETK